MVGDRGQDCSQGDENVLNLKITVETWETQWWKWKLGGITWKRLEEWVRQGPRTDD